MSRFSAFTVGAICGALVGSVAALLLAPSAGEELRTRAQEAISSFGDDIAKAYNERMGQLENELAVLRSEKPEPTE